MSNNLNYKSTAIKREEVGSSLGWQRNNIPNSAPLPHKRHTKPTATHMPRTIFSEKLNTSWTSPSHQAKEKTHSRIHIHTHIHKPGVKAETQHYLKPTTIPPFLPSSPPWGCNPHLSRNSKPGASP